MPPLRTGNQSHPLLTIFHINYMPKRTIILVLIVADCPRYKWQISHRLPQVISPTKPRHTPRAYSVLRQLLKGLGHRMMGRG